MTSKKSGSGRKKSSSKGEKSAPQVPLQRNWLRVGGVLFVATWMFVLGILVGRGTAPVKFDVERIQKELAELKAAALKRSTAEMATSARRDLSNGGPGAADLEFYEDLRASRQEVKFKAPAEKKLSPPAPKKTAEAVKKPNTTAAVAKKNAAKTVKPAPVKKVAKTRPPPVAGKPAGRQLTIQVASVKSPQVADRMVRDLKQKGYPAYTRIGKVAGKGIWYQVRVGHFSSRQKAADMLTRLRRDNWKALVVGR